jgi:tetratricopeptide (TPR) repeat protein
MKAGRLEEAEHKYTSLAENFPELPNGMVGLAWLAHEKADWEGAIARWTLCLEKYSNERSMHWRAAKADALRNLGRYEEASLLLEALSRQYPQERKFAKAFVRTAIGQAHKARQLPERYDELRSAVDLHFNADGGNAELIENIQLLARLGDHAAAQERLPAAMERATTVEEMEQLFVATGELVEFGSRGSIWEKLLLAVRAAAQKSRNRSRLLDLELRLLLALARFQEFTHRFDAAESELPVNGNFRLFRQIRARLGKPRNEVFAERKIFGIGLSRTGTQSLTRALDAFGIDAAHWTNPLTHQLISTTDIFLFGACADISVTQEFEKLYYQYPNALFIWTQRPLEDWAVSIARHYEFWHRTSDISGLQQEFGREVIPFGLSRAAIEFGLYLNAGSFEEAYRQFEQRVRSFFSNKPSGKLLELNFFEGQGWKELSAFLDLPAPEQPFPHVNKAV